MVYAIPGGPTGRTVVVPAPAYSRVVSLQIPDLRQDETGFRFTPVLGNRVRLLRVQVWLQQDTWGSVTQLESLFQVYTAMSLPMSVEQVLGCERVLPITGVSVVDYWVQLHALGYWDWWMDVLYEGSERRFGFMVTQVEDNALVSFASFTVSEG